MELKQAFTDEYSEQVSFYLTEMFREDSIRLLYKELNETPNHNLFEGKRFLLDIQLC